MLRCELIKSGQTNFSCPNIDEDFNCNIARLELIFGNQPIEASTASIEGIKTDGIPVKCSFITHYPKPPIKVK